jgi:molybdate transport system substrate-binding protein
MTMETNTQTLVKRTGFRAALLAAATVFAAGNPAGAAELRLLSAAAMQTVFNAIAVDFERTSGHTLNVTYRTMGDFTQRVLRGEGETADLVIGSTQSIERLVQEGKIDANSQMTIARVGIGAVVPTGTPKPPIGSVDEFKRALLAAKTVVYANPAGGGAAGIHVARVIEKLGLSEQLKPKTKYGAGGDITEVTLAQGRGAVGRTQISEIVDKPGAEFVGPLPDGLQNYTGVTAGIPAGAKPSAAVTAFIAFLQTPVAVATMERKGM